MNLNHREVIHCSCGADVNGGMRSLASHLRSVMHVAGPRVKSLLNRHRPLAEIAATLSKELKRPISRERIRQIAAKLGYKSPYCRMRYKQRGFNVWMNIEHWEALREIAVKRGFSNLTSYLRYVLIQEIEKHQPAGKA